MLGTPDDFASMVLIWAHGAPGERAALLSALAASIRGGDLVQEVGWQVVTRFVPLKALTSNQIRGARARVCWRGGSGGMIFLFCFCLEHLSE